MGLTEIIERADALLHDHDLRNRTIAEWKDKTKGHAIGAMPVYAPLEIVHAAGMLPVRIYGGGDQVEIIRGDAYFQSYICQIPRSTIELALSGRFDALDGFLFPSICDVIRNLSGMFQMLFSDKYVRYIDVPQNFEPEVGGRFWRGELEHLRSDLGEMAGREIGDDDLRRSIEAYNANRSALAAVYDLRAAEPWRVPASEAYLLTRAGDVLDVAEHTAMLGSYLDEVKSADRPMKDRARVMLVGCFCEQPPLGLLKTLEASGCYIVDDELALGARYIRSEIPTQGDPLEALTNAFLEAGVPSASRYEPRAKKGDYLVQLSKKRHAEGILLCAPSFCDPALLDQPMIETALDEASMPHTAFKYSESLGQFQVIREQAGTFADSIKLWSD